eukprot:3860312-Prymnesium_polylepis.2
MAMHQDDSARAPGFGDEMARRVKVPVDRTVGRVVNGNAKVHNAVFLVVTRRIRSRVHHMSDAVPPQPPPR